MMKTRASTQAPLQAPTHRLTWRRGVIGGHPCQTRRLPAAATAAIAATLHHRRATHCRTYTRLSRVRRATILAMRRLSHTRPPMAPRCMRRCHVCRRRSTGCLNRHRSTRTRTCTSRHTCTCTRSRHRLCHTHLLLPTCSLTRRGARHPTRTACCIQRRHTTLRLTSSGALALLPPSCCSRSRSRHCRLPRRSCPRWTGVASQLAPQPSRW
mmetsp:Transcript_31165/g.73595  ORF Transcript_31165/g.73595 Transcript_31165/m.73595 type:complete len:211 (+) Transcript_31165:645-1277(+)